MNCMHCTIPYFVPLSSNPKILFPSSPTQILAPSFSNPGLSLSLRKIPNGVLLKKRDVALRTSQHHNSNKNNNDSIKWMDWLPTGGFAADKVFKLISTTTASPIYQFIASPSTFLHSVDPRIKLVWLLALVVLPARSHIIMRVGLVILTSLLSVWILPKHVWMDQLGRVSLLSGVLFIMLGLGSDGIPSPVQLRTPPPAVMGLPNLPVSLGSYSYLLMKLGPLRFTRKGLSVASTAACLTFTVRNVALGIVSRRINWRQLTVLETIDIFASYIRRIFKNIFSHAEQISQAMIVRGFRGDSRTHKIYALSESSVGMADFVSLFCLVSVIGAAFLSEYFLV
ncbi:protein ABCI12, chloroplastic isoform X2 [Mangifera indica]|uniref:protein ABCI12, chloroplastic isoform X2 n=1 Tax=Mangifera indica TaxID=29780 RepID=UPI001CFAA436|nr:protein ABCI12, chloroplastic isoform X2 [Mangifera indica]